MTATIDSGDLSSKACERINIEVKTEQIQIKDTRIRQHYEIRNYLLYYTRFERLTSIEFCIRSSKMRCRYE